jgi:diaminopimelate epimerase
MRHPETDLVKVKTRGGQLEVTLQRNGENSFSDIWLTGPTKSVFTGKIEIE